MTTFNLAHVRIQGADVAVFDADARDNSNVSRDRLLAELTDRAILSGLRVQKSALAYQRGGRIHYHGTPDLVRYLAKAGLPRWTHTIQA